VLGLHAGPIDTDMASELTLPKVKPAEVVRHVLSAIEAGRDEVLADDMTRQVKAALSNEAGIYLNFDPDRTVALDSVERPISGHAAPGNELFRRPGQLASPSAAAGHSLDWTGAGAGLAARVHGRFLGPDACLACRGCVRAFPAKDQAGGRRARESLRPI
jgi:hypothetical protein